MGTATNEPRSAHRMVDIHFKLPELLDRELKTVAGIQMMSKSSLLRIIIRDFMRARYEYRAPD